MSSGSHLNQTNQPASQGSRRKTRKIFLVLQLFFAVLVALFLAGIVAPSILRNHARASGSLHTLTIAHITFTYTFWNLASAVLGVLFGAVVVAKSSPVRPGSAARIGRAFSHTLAKWRLFRETTIGQPISGATTWRDCCESTPVSKLSGKSSKLWPDTAGLIGEVDLGARNFTGFRDKLGM